MPTTSDKLDYSRLPESGWVTVDYSKDGLRRYDDYRLPDGSIVRRTVNLVETALIQRNQERLKESAGKRFGDGQVVASIPLNVFYRDFAKRLKEGDKDFTKWWLNNPENAMWRSFRGKV